jgi:subfamily B ATP-binding cassette protein MsbA
MKTYFRLLSFAKPIEKFAIPYVITTLLAVFFNTFNFTLLSPLLDTLFASGTHGMSVGATTKSVSDLDFLSKFREFIDYSILNNGKNATLQIVCTVILISVLLSNFFRYLSQRIMEDLRVYTLLNIRKKVFDNVMDLHIGYFNNERKGDIIAKISSDVQVVQFTVTNTLQVAFKEPLQLIFYVIVLLSVSVKLTLFALLVIPLSGLIISKIVKRLRKQATQAQESFARMIGFLDEALSGIKIVKGFNATGLIKERFQKENELYSNINRKMVRRQQLASPVSQSLGVLVVVMIVLYGGNLVINGSNEFTPSQFILYIAVFSQVMQPIKALSDSFSGIHTGISAGERVLSLIDTKPELVDKPDAIEVANFTTSIQIKGLNFNFGERQILSNINLEIKKGKTIALVGPSGGGKSTLMDIIPRFYDPLKGTLMFDGIDYRDLKVDSLRAQMGIVNQESFLFNDTIFNNIAFSRPNSTMQEVEAAARIANAHDFIIEQELGYNTFVGDRGNRLSGGQRQRISIARAVLANPPIMLLDEATSALDTESEKLVQMALNNLMKNRTSIVIAHRLSTIQHADQIIVIDQGSIKETGTHQELIAQNGIYKRLINMQTFND